MKFWDNLRTAYNLAERVEDCERSVAEVLYEWGETQEKMLSREERLRKRLSRELKATLEEKPLAEDSNQQSIVSQAGSQQAKMAIVRKFRESRKGE